MDYGHDKIRLKVEGDRLSSLSDDLIHKILSFLDITQAVKTSALSSRWRFIWTSMQCLNFSWADLRRECVTNVLSRRNNQIEVSSVKLDFDYNEVFFERILDYAFSQNVQRLTITCLHEWKVELPQSLFSSQCLKHLTFCGNIYELVVMTPHTWELPALSTLNLRGVRLYDDNTDKCAGLFSNCASLKNLTLTSCKVAGANSFNIRHPGVSNLTLEFGCADVNVVTPQLKSLTIKYQRETHLISAPNLSSFRYKDTCCPLQLSADFLHLEKVDICIFDPFEDKLNAYNMVSLLQQLHSVKFLTLNLEIIKLLSLSMEVVSHQPSPFSNLKSLKFYPDYYAAEKEETQPEVSISTQLKNYLLDGSPGAVFTMVSHEETRAVMNVASAQNSMRELQVVLDQLKEHSEINTADKDKDESHMESVMAAMLRGQPEMTTRLHFSKGMRHIERYWEDINEQMEKGYKNVGRIISMLREIERVLAKLPTSHRAKLQARFSGLCEEADTAMDNMMDHLKIQCDKKPRFKCLLS